MSANQSLFLCIIILNKKLIKVLVFQLDRMNFVRFIQKYWKTVFNVNKVISQTQRIIKEQIYVFLL